MKKTQIMLSVLLAAVLAVSTACGLVPASKGDVAATGTQNVVVIGEEWGAVVAKTVVTLDVTVSADSVAPERFIVYEVKGTVDSPDIPGSEVPTVMAARTVTAAYTCDAEGNPVEGDSNRICLELGYSPKEGSAFLYDSKTWTKTWRDPYELHLSITEDSSLTTADGAAITGLNVTPGIDLTEALMPQLQGVDLSGSYIGTDGMTLNYGAYAPPEDGHTNALVIWLHGAGEGGAGGKAGPVVANLGNEVTALYSEEFQRIMGGAYVLTPQAPTFWMQYDESGAWRDNPGVPSIFTATLMELIRSFVSGNPDIDPDRVIIGGCSNGGYMTMNMIMTYPDDFAAAFPICESYPSDAITNGQLTAIKDLPIWFVYALNDTTVNPHMVVIPTIRRLQAINEDVHVSEFEDVYGETYVGHWSWVYFFNNECIDEDGVNMWQWMSEQAK